MYYDLECPYCEEGLKVCHDDGIGYGEDEKNRMNCSHCGKDFVFSTSISYNYESEKADCLNDSDCKFELTHTHPKEFSKMRCSICDDERELTDAERLLNNIGTKDSYFKELNKKLCQKK